MSLRRNPANDKQAVRCCLTAAFMQLASPFCGPDTAARVLTVCMPYHVVLTAVNCVVQAGRVWRDGQKKRVYVYRLLATGSIEEKVPNNACNLTYVVHPRPLRAFRAHPTTRLWPRAAIAHATCIGRSV